MPSCFGNAIIKLMSKIQKKLMQAIKLITLISVSALVLFGLNMLAANTMSDMHQTCPVSEMSSLCPMTLDSHIDTWGNLWAIFNLDYSTLVIVICLAIVAASSCLPRSSVQILSISSNRTFRTSCSSCVRFMIALPPQIMNRTDHVLQVRTVYVLPTHGSERG